jgi:hypothetical protein
MFGQIYITGGNKWPSPEAGNLETRVNAGSDSINIVNLVISEKVFYDSTIGDTAL